MPDRIIRANILTSESVSSLSWGGEVFYRRLMSIADDFGRCDGRESVLRASLYAFQLDKVSTADIVKWKDECSNAGLVSRYHVEGKEYLLILKFNQRLRAMKSKFPAPPSDADTCCQMSAVCGHPSVETNRNESETKRDIVVEKSPITIPKISVEEKKAATIHRQKEFYETLVPFLSTYGKDMIRNFYDYWSETNKSHIKMRFELEKTWDLSKRLARWSNNDFRKKEKAGITQKSIVL
jgi:hypothetical protein